MDTQIKADRQGLGAGVKGLAEEQVFLVLPLLSILREAGVNSAEQLDTTETHCHMSLEACRLLGYFFLVFFFFSL